KQIYFPEQAADAVPFARAGIPELAGRTSAQVWQRFRLAVGGALAPRTAARMPRIVGLVGPHAEYGPRMHLVSDRFTKHLARYVARVADHRGRPTPSKATDLY